MKEKNTIIINIFGGPGAGKSTAASYIFAFLKMAGVNAEIIMEFAKEKTWEENSTAFENQAYIFGEQSYRISRCYRKVDVIITDSPILFSIIYNKTPGLTENFNQGIIDMFNSYNNMNYFLVRNYPYVSDGRWQKTAEEADDIGEKIEMLLKDNKIDYKKMPGCENTYKTIIEEVLEKVKEN